VDFFTKERISMKSKTSPTRQYRSSSMPAALAEQERSAVAHGGISTKISASPRVTEQRAVNAQIQNSPLVVAQRRGVEKIAETSKTAQMADDEELQKKSATSQLEMDEELQKKTTQLAMDEELQKKPVQLAMDEKLQKKTAQLETDDELQKKSIAVQREVDDELQKKQAPVQRVETSQHERTANNTGLPDNLKAGIESLSGISMDGVKVHYNSSQPAQLNALAYAQGTDIHVAPGQEQHLPHEAWHVVQQAQGRVQPTMQMKEGVSVNDDPGLEHEADVMGAKALQGKQGRWLEKNDGSVLASEPLAYQQKAVQRLKITAPVMQRALAEDLVSGATTTVIAGETHDEIPPSDERKTWRSRDVNVIYEAGELPDSAQKPDRPILRVAHAWIMLYDIAQQFWHLVEANQDVSGGPAVLDEQRTLATFIKDDMEEIGLGVDDRLIVAYDLLDALCRGLPENETALMQLPRVNQQYLAETKLALLPRINALISSIHKAGSFSDVSFDDDSLRTERSRQMLKAINSAKPQKTIYKVGDLHVDDMRRERMQAAVGIEVLSRTEYLDEYEDADVSPSSGGKAAFNSIGNNDL
jgi:Domain of unknown function (DUF4157)